MAETVSETIVGNKDIVEIPLSEIEHAQLEACENVIRKGLCTFLEVGRALAEIHDNRLYRETHSDFRLYYKDVWDLGKSRAYQQMDGYRVVKMLEDKMSTMVDISENDSTSNGIILPVNERQTRALLKLKKDPDALHKAWATVRKTLKDDPKAKLTGALINKAVKDVKGEVVKKEHKKRQVDLEATQRLSPLFKRQCKVMEEVINEERNAGWQSTSQKEAVKWLKTLVQLAESND
ncbi:MAG: hypothetical protein KKC20_00990 [Proteobacteria bacterium]|nr:hypothetical protein [Pseudomonadota bacterium]